MSSHSRRLIRVGVFLFLISGLAAVAWLWFTGGLNAPEDKGGKRRTAAVAVETMAVERVTMRDVRTFTGTLHPRAAFDVAPKISGRLEYLPVDIGDTVSKGQVVARLDDDELEQQVQQAKAELGVAKASLEEARSLLLVRENQLRRSKELFKRGIGAEAALESAQADRISQQARVQVARAQVTQREAALRGAQVRLSYTVIRMDWSGNGPKRVVGERYVSEGEMLTANKPIFSVLDIGELIAVVFATEADYALLQPGQKVSLLADALPGHEFPGHIARLAPRFEQESRQARMEVAVPNASGALKPGMYVRVEVEVSRAAQAFVVPQEAVVNRGGLKGVFVVEGEPPVARFVSVRTGLSRDNSIQVVEPVLTSPVVSLGQHLLQDGTPVRLAKNPNAPGKGTRDSGKSKSGGSGDGANPASRKSP